MVPPIPLDVVVGFCMTTGVADFLDSQGVFTMYLHVKSGLTTRNTMMTRTTHKCMNGCTVLRYFVTKKSTFMITEHPGLWMQHPLSPCVQAGGLVERPRGLIIRAIIHSYIVVLVPFSLVDNEELTPSTGIRRKLEVLASCSSLRRRVATTEQQ